ADSYFFPLYEEAQRLNMPICFHTGSGTPDFTPASEFFLSRFIRIGLPVTHAFHSMIMHGIPAQFPTLRFGFIEAGASWVPFALYNLRRQLERMGQGEGPFKRAGYEVRSDVLLTNRLFVTCQVDEDLPYILQFTGEDNLVVGSDY